MNRIQLKKELHLLIYDQEYSIEERLPNGELHLKNLLTNTSSILKETTLTQLLFKGELQFLESNGSQATSETKKQLSYKDFTQLPEALRKEAKRRYSYVDRVVKSTPDKQTTKTLEPIVAQVSKEISDSKPPSWLTLYRWYKSYIASGCDIRSLVPLHSGKGNRQSRLNPEVRQIIKDAIDVVYLNLTQAQGMDVYDRVLININQSNRLREKLGQKQLEIPHTSTIYREIAKLDPQETAIARYGRRIAGSMNDAVKQGPRPTRPLERVEIDHTKLPLFVVDIETRLPIGTPWLTSAVDKYSGVVLGYYASFNPPSYLSVMQCMSHAIVTKNYLKADYPNVENDWDTYGLPEVIVVDNGKEFYSTSFEDACLSLGIVIQYCPPKMPWYKSAIERYFGALNTQLLSHQPGKKFAKFMEQNDYDSRKNAVVSFDALQEILHIFIVDIYNQSGNPQLKSPRQKVWSKAIASFPPALPSSNNELKVLIGATVERTVTRRGIEFEGLIYNCSELARLRCELKQSTKTKVKYDPSDLSRVYVLDSVNCQFIEVPALHQEYTQGLTLWQHKVIKQLARLKADKIDIVALALAKEKIQTIVEGEWKKTKRGKTRQSMARWIGIDSSKSANQINEEILPKLSSKQNDLTKTTAEETIVSEPTSLKGISNCESAIANPSISPKLEAHSVKVIKSRTDLDLELQPKDSELEFVDEVEVTPIAEIESAEKIKHTEVEIEDNWQPDLSGWGVFKGWTT
ncbi:MAG: Mu transposase C-terminal domain-containing protein [Cyanobacteria bacterium J06600_6]